mmetsp:Transcript_9375/g.13879  ORF Transcript_9375/g.13879 Transcript_9375/m.13879 type:complete len:218 (+) Transcript_9375:250-903(+)|eukprot:CAMPEP_0194765062 /NCGR_PEP_ID=MMETSP0323_2-20130528/24698_1 /TAXON_ID=2866 ORGANISM="Crypthecodinium cohnii, Strain Seligo" /NCGR_SAMPLE_ID=MMETSP0323_2 /ASSEMBLY_ACC=CAM_ASM_000346 /LENGTH=217 /DNA_ID=CAMNT_0039693631 /DNA_START=172 /DNA_END=825 /DNA_ORIENTATION=+
MWWASFCCRRLARTLPGHSGEQRPLELGKARPHRGLNEPDLERAALLHAQDGDPSEGGSLELALSLLGGRAHKISSSAHATGKELRSRLSIVLHIPEDELLLVRSGEGDPTSVRIVHDDDRPFYIDPEASPTSPAKPSVGFEEMQGEVALAVADADDDELPAYPSLELLRTRRRAGGGGSELTTWDLDQVDGLLALISVVRSNDTSDSKRRKTGAAR